MAWQSYYYAAYCTPWTILSLLHQSCIVLSLSCCFPNSFVAEWMAGWFRDHRYLCEIWRCDSTKYRPDVLHIETKKRLCGTQQPRSYALNHFNYTDARSSCIYIYIKNLLSSQVGNICLQMPKILLSCASLYAFPSMRLLPLLLFLLPVSHAECYCARAFMVGSFVFRHCTCYCPLEFFRWPFSPESRSKKICVLFIFVSHSLLSLVSFVSCRLLAHFGSLLGFTCFVQTAISNSFSTHSTLHC